MRRKNEMTKLIQCENIKFNSKPGIWLSSNSNSEPQKAILVSVVAGRSNYQFCNLMNLNLDTAKEPVVKVLTGFAASKASCKDMVIKNLITVVKSAEGLKNYQTYFDLDLSQLSRGSIIIEDLTQFKKILTMKDSTELSLPNLMNVPLTQSEKAKNSEMKMHVANPVSSYAVTTSNLTTIAIRKDNEVEFDIPDFDSIKWTRIPPDKMQFMCDDYEKIHKITTLLFQRAENKILDYKDDFTALLTESNPGKLVCSEKMLTALFGLKHVDNFIQPHQLQAALSQTKVFQAKHSHSFGEEIIRIIKTSEDNQRAINPIVYCFEKMKLAWTLEKSKFFTIGSEEAINLLMQEIKANIVSNLSEAERISELMLLKKNKQPDGFIRLEYRFDSLQRFFGRPTISIVKNKEEPIFTLNSEKNAVESLRQELNRLLQKLKENLNNDSQLLDILTQISNPHTVAIDDIQQYIKQNIADKYHDELFETVVTLSAFLQESITTSNLEKQDIRIETCDFLNHHITQLQNEITKKQIQSQLREKFFQENPVKNRPTLSTTSSTQQFHPVKNVKRKPKDIEPEQQSMDRKKINADKNLMELCNNNFPSTKITATFDDNDFVSQFLSF